MFFFLGLLVGVFSLIILNFFINNNLINFTAPGVAAFVSLCTFTLALWSAYKVNRWMNSKINEKAFKKCEEIIETIHKSITKLLRTNIYATRIFELNKNTFISTEDDIKKSLDINESYLKEADEMDVLLLEMITSQHQLQFWGFSIEEKYNTIKLYDLFLEYRALVTEAFEKINEGIPEKHQEFKMLEKKILTKYQSMISYNRDVFESKFNQIFKENSRK